MLRRVILLLSVFICVQALLAQEREVPDDVLTALEALSDSIREEESGRLARRYMRILEDRDLRLTDLESYDYAPSYAQERSLCTIHPENRAGSDLYPVPVYVVNLRLKHADGGELTFTYHVAVGGEATYCGVDYAAATPTPTIDATRTTYTPTFTQTYTPSPTLTFTPSLTPTPSNTFTPSYTPSPTLTFTPSNTPTPSATPRPNAVTCPGFMTSRLMAGEQGRVLPPDPLRLRDAPSTAGTQLATIPAGATFDVLEGPECDPVGRAWWRVSYRNTVGWTVEGQGEAYFTEPLIGSEAAVTITFTPSRTQRVTPAATDIVETVTCAGFMPSRLTIGGQGRVTPGTPNNVRSAPSPSGALVGQIDGGAIFNVLEGPTCDPAGRAWWRVEHNGITGWTAEGQGNTYFVEPVEAISEDASRLLTPDSP